MGNRKEHIKAQKKAGFYQNYLEVNIVVYTCAESKLILCNLLDIRIMKKNTISLNKKIHIFIFNLFSFV